MIDGNLQCLGKMSVYLIGTYRGLALQQVTYRPLTILCRGFQYTESDILSS